MINTIAQVQRRMPGVFVTAEARYPVHRIASPLVFTLASGLFLVALLGSADAVNAAEFEAPEILAHVAVQAELYSGGDEPESGSPLPPSRYVVREAAIELIGSIGDRIEYNIEAGTASCMGGSQFALMEAGVFYRFSEKMKIGFMQGHIKRGFDLGQECTEVLTAEKPWWSKTLSPCHPIGAVFDFAIPLRGHAGIEGQLAYLNGHDGTLEDEHDANIGLVVHTPLQGLSIGGYYNDAAIGVGWDDDGTIYEPGYRAAMGADFQRGNALFRGEYYLAKAFERSAVGPGPDDLQSHEMTAFYVEGGYKLPTGIVFAPYSLPYVRYQVWDKASHDSGDHEFSYFTAGMSIGLGDEGSTLRIDYETPTSVPDGESEEPDRLIVRVQTDL